jgi:hypothetical protein
VGAVLLAVLVLAATGLMDILDLSLLAAVAIVALGVLTPNQARNAVDLNVIVLTAASFGLGAALQQSGLAESLASGLISVFDPFGDLGLLLGVLLATIILTEMITNNAAAVLMFPSRSPPQSRRPSAAGLCFPDRHRSERFVPLPYRLPDQHDGLRNGRIPLHGLRSIGLPANDRRDRARRGLHSAVLAAQLRDLTW